MNGCRGSRGKRTELNGDLTEGDRGEVKGGEEQMGGEVEKGEGMDDSQAST